VQIGIRFRFMSLAAAVSAEYNSARCCDLPIAAQNLKLADGISFSAAPEIIAQIFWSSYPH
jgi:hypothetical protein